MAGPVLAVLLFDGLWLERLEVVEARQEPVLVLKHEAQPLGEPVGVRELGDAKAVITDTELSPVMKEALAQCSGWLSKNLPNTLQLPTNSTVEPNSTSAGAHNNAINAPTAIMGIPTPKLICLEPM